jgi:hypothetical protein
MVDYPLTHTENPAYEETGDETKNYTEKKQRWKCRLIEENELGKGPAQRSGEKTYETVIQQTHAKCHDYPH